MIKHSVLIAGLAVVASSLKIDTAGSGGGDAEFCADLRSVEGTHYTVGVEAGTPPQKFDLVIDTGSSNVIIESCECRASKFCEEENKCFDSKASSTLQISDANQRPEMVVLMFGSGPIETVISTDIVRMGSVAVTLDRGLFLMLDQMLDFSGPFEGIMGLGLPKEYRQRKRTSYALHRKKGNLRRKKSDWKPVGHGPTGFQWNEDPEEDRSHKSVHMHQNASVSLNDTLKGSSGRRILDAIHQKRYESDFLRKAGVSRFSMCFSEDWDGGGMLRLNTLPSKETFSNIGSVHWALDFRGATVGNTKRSKFCRPENMEQGQETPCGAILDSGTTYILGQEDHLVELYEDLCEQWPRCKKNHTAMQRAEKKKSSSEAAVWSKYTAFEALLSDCNTWYDSPEGLNELPSINFHIHSDGNNKVLTLKPWAFIVARYEATNQPAQSEDDISPNEAFLGAANSSGRTSEGTKQQWMCEAALGVMDYPTPRNGPAWVLGMPLFYSYVVQYDISTDPPTVSFSTDGCRGCGRSEHSNLTSHGAHPYEPRNWRRRRPRQMKGRPRMPDIDLQQPL